MRTFLKIKKIVDRFRKGPYRRSNLCTREPSLKFCSIQPTTQKQRKRRIYAPLPKLSSSRDITYHMRIVDRHQQIMIAFHQLLQLQFFDGLRKVDRPSEPNPYISLGNTLRSVMLDIEIDCCQPRLIRTCHKLLIKIMALPITHSLVPGCFLQQGHKCRR